jgi:hypothetical protein
LATIWVSAEEVSAEGGFFRWSTLLEDLVGKAGVPAAREVPTHARASLSEVQDTEHELLADGMPGREFSGTYPTGPGRAGSTDRADAGQGVLE